jgi:hypothetical protein
VRLAVWNIRPFTVAFEGARDLEVLFCEPSDCKTMLDAGEVDLALLEPAIALADVESYPILDACVLASVKSFPYASLEFSGGINDVSLIQSSGALNQAAVVARIVLQEQYDLETRILPKEGESSDQSSTAHLSFGNPQPDSGSARSSLDIGQEWFELTAVPLVWGVFCASGERVSGLPAGHFETLVSGAWIRERLLEWLAEDPTVSEPEVSAFVDDIRFQFDPEVVAGLDELAHYLFYYGVIDDIPKPRFISSPDSVRPSN